MIIVKLIMLLSLNANASSYDLKVYERYIEKEPYDIQLDLDACIIENQFLKSIEFRENKCANYKHTFMAGMGGIALGLVAGFILFNKK